MKYNVLLTEYHLDEVLVELCLNHYRATFWHVVQKAQKRNRFERHSSFVIPLVLRVLQSTLKVFQASEEEVRLQIMSRAYLAVGALAIGLNSYCESLLSGEQLPTCLVEKEHMAIVRHQAEKFKVTEREMGMFLLIHWAIGEICLRSNSLNNLQRLTRHPELVTRYAFEAPNASEHVPLTILNTLKKRTAKRRKDVLERLLMDGMDRCLAEINIKTRAPQGQQVFIN